MITKKIAVDVPDGKYSGLWSRGRLTWKVDGQEVICEPAPFELNDGAPVSFEVRNGAVVNDSAYLTSENSLELQNSFSTYLKCRREFHETSKAFQQACRSLRHDLSFNAERFITVTGTRYRVTSDSDGDFDVEEMS